MVNAKAAALQPPPEWIGHLSGDEFYRVFISMKRAIKKSRSEKNTFPLSPAIGTRFRYEETIRLMRIPGRWTKAVEACGTGRGNKDVNETMRKLPFESLIAVRDLDDETDLMEKKRRSFQETWASAGEIDAIHVNYLTKCVK